MNKIVLIFLISILCRPSLWCQWSLSVDAGYGFEWASDEIPDGSIMDINNSVREIQAFKKSFGAGINYTLTVSHRIRPSLELMCQIGYLDGASSTLTRKFLSQAEANDTYSSRMVYVEPGMKMKFDAGKLTISAHVAPSIGLLGKISLVQEVKTKQATSQSEWVSSGGVSWGIVSGAGIGYDLNKRFAFFLEARLRSASFAPNQAEKVKWTQNGADLLTSVLENEKKILYKDKYQIDANAPSDPRKPAISTSEYYPFSSLGINLGVTYKLSCSKS